MTRMTRKLGLAAWLGAATLMLAACAGSGGSPAPATSAPVAPTAAPASEPPPVTATVEPASQAPASVAPACAVVEGGTATTAEIRGFSFPAGLSVQAGEAITWANLDNAPHTVTFDDGSCASGSIGPDASTTVRYDVPGTYPFHCAIHPNMTGSLEVRG